MALFPTNIQPSLELKTRPRQLLALPLAFALSELKIYGFRLRSLEAKRGKNKITKSLSYKVIIDPYNVIS
jgi:hypothetical protein